MAGSSKKSPLPLLVEVAVAATEVLTSVLVSDRRPGFLRALGVRHSPLQPPCRHLENLQAYIIPETDHELTAELRGVISPFQEHVWLRTRLIEAVQVAFKSFSIKTSNISIRNQLCLTLGALGCIQNDSSAIIVSVGC